MTDARKIYGYGVAIVLGLIGVALFADKVWGHQQPKPHTIVIGEIDMARTLSCRTKDVAIALAKEVVKSPEIPTERGRAILGSGECRVVAGETQWGPAVWIGGADGEVQVAQVVLRGTITAYTVLYNFHLVEPGKDS